MSTDRPTLVTHSQEPRDCQLISEAVDRSVSRALALSQKLRAPKRRCIVLMVPDDLTAIGVPLGIQGRYERTQRCIGDWQLGVVVSSGLEEFRTGQSVACNKCDGLVFTGGLYDRDSLAVQALLEPEEVLKFYRPFRVPAEYNRRFPVECQFDLSKILVGI